MLAFLYCSNIENLMDIVISYLNIFSEYQDKCTSVVKLISLANTFNLFSLEVVQKYQHYLLYVLRENSDMNVFAGTIDLWISYMTETVTGEGDGLTDVPSNHHHHKQPRSADDR